jgi:hypothetical protein
VIDARRAIPADSAQDRDTREILVAQQINYLLIEQFSMPFVGFADVDAHERPFTCELLVCHRSS